MPSGLFGSGNLGYRLVLVRIEFLALGLDRLDAVTASSRCISRSVASMPSISGFHRAVGGCAGFGRQHLQGPAQRLSVTDSMSRANLVIA